VELWKPVDVADRQPRGDHLDDRRDQRLEREPVVLGAADERGEAAHEIGRGIGVLVIAAISLLVYLAAYRLRLPGRRVEELIDEAASRG
jgi:hypothetical protein